MTESNPPGFLPSPASHSAAEARRAFSALVQRKRPGYGGSVTGGGVRRLLSDLVPSLAPSGLGVVVSAGQALVSSANDDSAYHVYNDAPKTLTLAAAHATLVRYDLVYARVTDADFGGANSWALAVATGTAGAGVAPSPPSGAMVIATVRVAAAATTSAGLTLTDLRPRASALGGVTYASDALMPANPEPGDLVYDVDTDRLLVMKADGKYHCVSPTAVDGALAAISSTPLTFSGSYASFAASTITDPFGVGVPFRVEVAATLTLVSTSGTNIDVQLRADSDVLSTERVVTNTVDNAAVTLAGAKDYTAAGSQSAVIRLYANKTSGPATSMYAFHHDWHATCHAI